MSSLREPKVVSIRVWPFEAKGEQDKRLQNNGSNELKSAIFEALGRARDLTIAFSDLEDVADIAAEKAERLQQAPVVSGTVSRKIEVAEQDYEIKTTYMSLGLSRFRVDAAVIKVKGVVQVAMKSSEVNVRDVNPLGPLGKELLNTFRSLMGLPDRKSVV